LSSLDLASVETLSDSTNFDLAIDWRISALCAGPLASLIRRGR
jgi:hypothetical protein